MLYELASLFAIWKIMGPGLGRFGTQDQKILS